MINNLSKEILFQYVELVEEVKETKRKIKVLEHKIKCIEEDGSVIDSVKGGAGGTQNFKVSGFPYPQYSKIKSLLIARKGKLETLEFKSLEMINSVEEFIYNIEDARMRRLLSYRYIEDLSWVQVAHKMGGRHTSESCRKAVERFLSEG